MRFLLVIIIFFTLNSFICFDNMSLVYKLGKNSINDINNLYLPTEKERKQVLYNISYNQWTLEELKTGEAINYMFNLLNNYLNWTQALMHSLKINL